MFGEPPPTTAPPTPTTTIMEGDSMISTLGALRALSDRVDLLHQGLMELRARLEAPSGGDPLERGQQILASVIRDLKDAIVAGRPSGNSVIIQIPGEAMGLLTNLGGGVAQLFARNVREGGAIGRDVAAAVGGAAAGPPGANIAAAVHDAVAPEVVPPPEGMGRGPVVGVAVVGPVPPAE